MKIPFFFYNEKNKTWIVYLAFFSYSQADVAWMECEELENHYTLEPRVEFIPENSTWIFNNELDALKKMKELWAQVAV